MIKPLLLSSICVLLVSCQASKTANVQTQSYLLSNLHHGIFKANKDQVGEVCPELKAGQTLKFKLESNLPVLFNFHYHQDKETHYPINERNLTEIQEAFMASIDNTYCLMWKTHLDGTKIKYQYQILNSDKSQ